MMVVEILCHRLVQMRLVQMRLRNKFVSNEYSLGLIIQGGKMDLR